MGENKLLQMRREKINNAGGGDGEVSDMRNSGREAAVEWL